MLDGLCQTDLRLRTLLSKIEFLRTLLDLLEPQSSRIVAIKAPKIVIVWVRVPSEPLY